MRKKSILLLTLLLGLSLAGCNNEQDIKQASDGNVIEERAQYENVFGEDRIAGQWENYGIGDPYILRHNGKYYLYVSTKDSETGIRAWESEDLMNWSQVQCEGLPLGYVTTHAITKAAYAPEVIYKNGVFYMITSPGGNGHYILSAPSPVGPFIPITTNIGNSIDGSFFIDDDEQMYLTTADNSGIKIVAVNDDMTLGESRFLLDTQIGSWTEGPYVLKKDGTYFLTFTGNHVTSDGYRIAYSYSQDKLFDRRAFTYGDNILLSTEADFKGLGHSATVLGPNLDSYYITYHNLINAGGPVRGFNLNRLYFNGAQMVIDNQQISGNYVPQMPEFSTNDGSALQQTSNYLLSESTTKNRFTAEYNYVGANQKIIFGYQDASNYGFVEVKENTINVISVVSGTHTTLATKTLSKQYDYTKLHTIRVSYDKKINVFFDNMQVISNVEMNVNGGKIGYAANDGLTIGYTAYSNHANGSSDNEEIKTNQVQANAYDLKDYLFTKDSGLKTIDSEGFYRTGGQQLVLSNALDYAKYAIKITENTFYGVEVVLQAKYCGKTVGIQIDDATIMKVKVPMVESEDITPETFVRLTLTELTLPKGTHYFKFIGYDEFAFAEFNLFKSSKVSPSFSNDLSDYIVTGGEYVNSWKLNDGGHYALAGNRQLLYFGDDTFTDFTMSADITFIGETQTSTAGFILRGGNPSFSVHDTNESIQGYYVGFNNSKAFISRYNYNLSVGDLDVMANSYASNQEFNLKVTLKGNTITVYIDNKKVLSYTDTLGFTHGRIGFYTEGAQAIYKNLVITK